MQVQLAAARALADIFEKRGADFVHALGPALLESLHALATTAPSTAQVAAAEALLTAAVTLVGLAADDNSESPLQCYEL